MLDARLGDRPYLGGEAPSVADFYAYWALTTYGRLTGQPLPDGLRGLVDRIGGRPTVEAARAAER